MKLFQRITALLLAVMLLTSLFPVRAGASQQETIQYQFSMLNPCYADILTEEDLPPFPESRVQTYSTPNYVDTVEEAAAVLRDQMRDHAETATVYIKTTRADEEYLNALFSDIFNEAMRHTGDPVEGDYLKWLWDGASGSISGEGTDDGYEIVFTYAISYYTTAAQEEELDEAVEDLLNDLNLSGKSDYQKSKAVYDYICANITYDHTSTTMLKHTAYAALINKTAVCQGYASLYYRLMLDLGVDIRVVAGSTSGGDHGWNIVELDNLYYNADPTWDAGATQYSYFLRSMDNFPDHNRWPDYTTSEFNTAYPMGSTDYVPSVCEVNGHSYGDWYQAKAPTTTEEGQEQRDCANCDAYETRTVDKLPDPYSGNCGDNLTWVYDKESRTVTISGTGNMYDYSAGSAPWCDMELGASPIKAAVIEDGVTSIGEFAFVTCDSLKSVSIAGSVTTIGSNAFSNSESLSSIVIPEGVISIGESAFRNCYAMTSAALPASVTSIGSQAFANCEYLTEISVDAKNPSYSSDTSGILFNKDKTTLVQAPGAISGSYTVPESVTAIGAWAFSGCDELNEITFCSDAPSFGNSAFYRVTATAYYPASNATWTEDVMQDYDGDITWVPYGDESATSGTCGENLTWVFEEETRTLTISGTGEMDSYASASTPWAEFSSSIFKVIINDGATSIGDGAFLNCNCLTEVSIPYGVHSIGSNAFDGCSALTNVILPNSLTQIGSVAFANCSSLTHITLPEGITTLPQALFMQSGLTEIVLPSTISVIDIGAFYTCKNLTSITIPANTTNIWAIAFAYCSSLKEIHFEGNAPSMWTATNDEPYEQGSFHECTLTAYYPANNSTWTEDVMLDYGGTITWKPYCLNSHSWDDGVVTEEASCTEPGYVSYTCTVCGETKTEEIPATGHSFGAWYETKAPTEEEAGEEQRDCANCDACETREIEKLTPSDPTSGTCGENLTWVFDEETGTLTISGTGEMDNFIKEDSSGIYYPGESPWYAYKDQLKHVVIEEGVTTIGHCAFCLSSMLEDVTIPDGVTSIGEWAFDGCVKLKAIVLPNSLKLIEQYAFADTGLREIIIPEGVTKIEGCCFDGCTNLTSVKLSKNITEIPFAAFASCGFAQFEIPSSVTVIGSNAFYNCTALTSITIPKSITTIEEFAFADCTGLGSITFEGNAPEFPFDDPSDEPQECNAFQNVVATAYYPANNATWTTDVMQDYGGDITWVAYGDESATSGTCGENITWAFEESSGTLTISGTESIARSNGNSVMDDYASAEETPWYPYQDQIVTVVIKSTVDSVGSNAFSGCSNLTTVIIEEGISEIDSTAFSGCDSLETCYYEGRKEAWENLGADVGEAEIHVESADPKAHTETKTTVAPTCTEQGYDLYTCSCGVERRDHFVDVTGHSWNEGTITKEPTAEEPGIKTYKCTVCKETRTEEIPYEAPEESPVKRISGKDRVKTALSVAKALKDTLGVEKFEAVVLAIGDNEKFADALAGSYLANVKKAPILLYTASGLSKLNVEFIENNLKENGTIYLLGGTGAIPAEVADELAAYGNVVRLSGKTRYETNLKILEEAGVGGKEILVSTGENFADSLSASAVGLPILLVNGKKTELTAEQTEFLKTNGKRVTIIGGTGAISAEIEAAIEEIVGTDVARISGKTRHNTSVLIAQMYFTNPTAALLTYSDNFPDGLAGGPLAYALRAPLLLTNAGKEDIANEYITENEIEGGYILGGDAAVSDATAKKVFALSDNAVITKAYYTE